MKTGRSFDAHTYVGNFFPNMNYIKNSYSTRLTDDSLQSCVKIIPYSPHVLADALNLDARAEITLSLIALTNLKCDT